MTIGSTSRSLVAHSGSKEGLHQDQGDLKSEVSTAGQGQRLSKSLVSVSLPYTDLQGRVLRLWKYGAKLIASMVNSCGETRIISGKKIHNALGATDTDDVLLARIEKISMRMWQLAYVEESGDLYVWPYLAAAGRDSPLSNMRSAFQNMRKHLADDPDVNHDSAKTYTHAQAAVEEKNGRAFFMKDGRRANHIQEVDDFRRGCLGNALGCQDRIGKLEKAIKENKKGEKYEDPEPGRKGKFLNPEEANQRILEYKALQREGFELLERLTDPSYAFEEVLQQNGLTDSYNATHPKNPVPASGASGGSIGGVGNEVGIIKGLFDSLEDMEERCHYFFMPSVTDTQPFSDEDLRTIIHDLAVGIYIHDSIPFFSLHFNGDSNLYPVIHPVYQNTLVGRVISMLDYHMKGFLNGTFFDEAFIHEWQTTKTQDTAVLMPHCIDIREYCKRHLPSGVEYFSIMELLQRLEYNEGPKDEASGAKEHTGFSNYDGFRSSFRIIAKQNSFKKTGRLFEIDAGFDVLYTIEPDAIYQAELDKYRCQFGKNPSGYERLVRAYNIMKFQIETIMPRLPVFRELFEQLKIINFFSYYFKTLKKASKIPILEWAVSKKTEGVPLFPHLPLRKLKFEQIEIDFSDVFDRLPRDQFAIVCDYIRGKKPGVVPEKIFGIILPAFNEYLQSKMPFLLSEEKVDMDKRKNTIESFLKAGILGAEEALREAIAQMPEREKMVPELRLEIKKLQDAELRMKEIIRNAEATKSEVIRKPSHYEFFALSKCCTFIKEKQEVLKKFEEARHEEEGQVLIISELLQATRENTDNPFGFFVKTRAISAYEAHSFIRCVKDLSDSERDMTQRVVGGCGQDMQVRSIMPIPNGGAHLQCCFLDLLNRPEEQFCPVHLESYAKVDGYAFSVRLADAATVSDDEYSWLLPLVPQGDQEAFIRRAQLFEAISDGDMEEFNACISVEYLNCQDSQGASLAHIAAGCPTPLFMQRLVDLKANFSLLDNDGYTPLHYAAKSGSRENCAFLLHYYPQLLNEVSKNGSSPLYVAVQHNRMDNIPLFLEKGADPNARTVYGMTPLYCAVHHGYEEAAQMLIANTKTKVDLALEDGTTPLFVAIEANMLSIFNALIAKGANVNQQRRDGLAPLHMAFMKATPMICSLLLDAPGIDVNIRMRSGKTILFLAVERDDIVFTELALGYKADVVIYGYDNETPVMAAIRAYNQPAVMWILATCKVHNPSKVPELVHQKNIRGESALDLAFRLRQSSSLFFLIKFNVTLPPTEEYLRLLCENFMDPIYFEHYLHSRKFTERELGRVYYQAYQSGNLLAVQIMQRNKAAVEFTDPQGWTGAHYGAKFDCTRTMTKFLESKPKDLLQMTKDGLSIAAIAAMHGSRKVFKMIVKDMIEEKVDLRFQFHGKHLLLACVQSRDHEIVDILLYKTFDAKCIVDDLQRTALHYAAIQGDVEMMDLLRRRGADFQVKDALSKSAVHYAFEYGWRDAIKYLLNIKYEIKLPPNILTCITKDTFVKDIKKLVDMQFDIEAVKDESNRTAIYEAIASDNYPVFALLIERGAKLDHRCAEGYTPFLFAARIGASKYLRELYKVSCKDVLPDGRTALHIATLAGHEDAVVELLKAGMSPRVPSLAGSTAVDVSLENRFWNICELLSGNEERLRIHKMEVEKAIKTEDGVGFFKLIEKLPLNAPMRFSSGVMPLLHLIYHMSPTPLFRDVCLHTFLALPGVDPHARDLKGLALSHLMAIGGDPIDFNTVDPLLKDAEGMTVLHYCAANNGDESVEQLQKALAHCKNCSVENGNGMTPLHLAIEHGNYEHAKVLLESGANANVGTAKCHTPLGLAVLNDMPLFVRLLLDHGACINQIAFDRRVAPLHIALENDNVVIARILLESGADVERPKLRNIRPVHIAARQGSIPLMRLLVSFKVSLKEKDDNGWGVGHYAALSDSPEIFAYLRGLRAPINVAAVRVSLSVRERFPGMSGVTPFHLAAERGKPEILKILLRCGCSPEKEADGRVTPLQSAAMGTSKKAVQFFEKYRIFQDGEQIYESTKAALVHDAPEALAVLQKNGDELVKTPFGDGNTAAHLAASYGAMRTIHYLRSCGIDFTQKNSSGKTAFELAVTENRLSVARYLLRETDAVDIKARSSRSGTYLHIAIGEGFVEMAALLIEYGAPLEEKMFYVGTPLQSAVQKENIPLVHLLLAAGAEISVDSWEALPKDNHTLGSLMKTYAEQRLLAAKLQETVIHAAIRLNDLQFFAVLPHRADVNAANARGETPLSLAMEAQNEPFIRMLIESGAAHSPAEDGLIEKLLRR